MLNRLCGPRWLGRQVGRQCGLVAAAVLALAFPQAVFGRDIYVAPAGNDAWSGSAPDQAASGAGPKLTLAGALREARKIRKENPQLQEPINVLLKGGVYEVAETIEVTPEDSGTEGSPLVIKAMPGETPVLSGGTVPTLSGQAASGWQYRLSADGGSLPVSQFYLGDERRQLSKLPKSGYYYVDGAVDAGNASARDALKTVPGDIGTLSQPDRVVARVFHNWSVFTLRVRAWDPATHVLTFETPFPGQRRIPIDQSFWYLLENVADGPLAPGEWRADPAGLELTYAPRPGEKAGGLEPRIARLETILRIRGASGSGRKAQFVRVEGLSFAHTGWSLAPTGLRSIQGAVYTPGAVEVSSARDIAFGSCSFYATGAYGLVMGADVERGSVHDSTFRNLGAGGIRIGSGEPKDLKVAGQWTSDCQVRNCVISGFGQVHPDGVGIWVGYAGKVTIDHNEVAHGYYSGISVGWLWSYGVYAAHDNIITGNRVWNLGQNVLSDMGGIYTLGEQPGSAIRDNLVSDIQASRYGGWGIYCDEGSAGFEVRNNLAYNLSSSAMIIHWGRDLDVESNLFFAGRNFAFENTNPEKSGAFVFRNNILVTSAQPFFGNRGLRGDTQASHNLYVDTGHLGSHFPAGGNIGSWQRREPTAESGDPGFSDPLAGDLTASHPELLAARGIDLATILKAGPAPVRHAPATESSWWDPAPEPRSIEFDFNFDAQGKDELAAFTKSFAAPTEDVELSTERSHSPPSSLRFADGPSGAAWQPLISRMVYIRNGKVHVSMWLWAESGSTPWVALRDFREPITTGIAVSVSPQGQLTANGARLMAFPFGTWVKADITFGIGSARTGTWDLGIEDEHGLSRSFPGLALPPSFLAFDWLGLAANGTSRTTFYVDDLSLAVSKGPP